MKIHSAGGLHLIYSFERLAAIPALVLLFPLLVLIAVATAVLSRRGPLVTHTRVGRFGKPLHMVKFRTMWSPGDPSGGWFTVERIVSAPSGLKETEDPRVPNGFAAFCRRCSLDELPQLWHVARGEMSLVGPRPITRVELDRHYPDCAGEVLSVLPGLTGLWQVRGRNRLTYAARRRMDLIFVRRASAGLYLRILLLSVPRVLSGAGAY